MTRIHAIVTNRRIDVAAPNEMPDGAEVVVELSFPSERIGLDESEWRDDPEAIAAWSAWLDTIEPVEFVQEGAFEEEFRRFNIEAVRKQMCGGNP